MFTRDTAKVMNAKRTKIASSIKKQKSDAGKLGYKALVKNRSQREQKESEEKHDSNNIFSPIKPMMTRAKTRESNIRIYGLKETEIKGGAVINLETMRKFGILHRIIPFIVMIVTLKWT